MLSYDWMDTWTVERIEKELDGLIFRGPAWYQSDSDTVLILPTNDPITFQVLVWNGIGIREKIRELVNLPVYDCPVP